MDERTRDLVSELKRVQGTARDAIRAVRALEREVGGDVFGRFVLASDEQVDDFASAELLAFLRHARHLYTGHELTVLVIAKADRDDDE